MTPFTSLAKAKESIASGVLDEQITRLYACGDERIAHFRTRFLNALDRFSEIYGSEREIAIFSAPGRTEVGGNHTDHQRGRVLAASVNLDVIAIAALRNDSVVHIQSEGYLEDVVDITDHSIHSEETNHSPSLVRGVCAKYAEMGYSVGGFDAYTTSDVLSGSGLSSSAAFEVLIGTIVNELFCEGKETALKIAQIGQYAENVYFGKPSGLMDQAASSVGGLVMIDFEKKENPLVCKVDFNFATSGHALCIIDTKGNHSDLTPDYAAIPTEMRQIASYFGKEVLREVPEAEFYEAIPKLRETVSDRGILRTMHFFEENKRVVREMDALEQGITGNFERFKELIVESGRSSYCYLQNVFSPAHPDEQGVSLVLAMCERLLAPKGGAWRVHGGGFAGTVQTFVPNDYLEDFVCEMEKVLGEKSCHILQIRPIGGTRVL